MAKLFVIGIGGTGMRCLESFVHTCAIGMYDNDEIVMLALDTDSGNGNFATLREVVSQYQILNGNQTKSNTFFSAPIKYLEFSPGYGETDNFGTISNYSTAAQHRDETPAADFIDLFLEPNVRNMPLKQGYRAQTQMGSILMYYAIQRAAYQAKNNMHSDARNDLREFITELANAEKGSPVFVFGSVFGGTGASSIPIIPKALNQASRILDKGNDLISNLRFGSMVLTNYFYFDVTAPRAGEVIAKSTNFAINSQAAMMFYQEDQTVNTTYRRQYLLGRSTQHNVTEGRQGSVGGADQNNPADYIELLSAFAAYDFFKEAKKGDAAFKNDNSRFFCIAHDYEGKKMDYQLFAQANAEVFKRKLGAMTAFSVLDTEGINLVINVIKANHFNINQDGPEVEALKKYFALFNISYDRDGNVIPGWLPQVYASAGGQGLLFAGKMFECRNSKEISKFKINQELFFGENPPSFSAGNFLGTNMRDVFDVVRRKFASGLDLNMSNMNDLMSLMYATFMKLYFNE